MLTAVLHTRNRPEFLARAIRHYAEDFNHPMIVTDGSTEEKLAETKRRLAPIKTRFPLELVHHAYDTPFLDRMANVVGSVKTPYVLLMADDDFYFPSWPDLGIAHLNANPSCGTVYGHTLHFEVKGGYVPFGDIDQFYFSVPNPVARFLDDESPVDRLRELGKGPFTTTGWYALQRTEILRTIIDRTRAARFDQLLEKGESIGDLYMLERLYNLVQPIHGRVSMLDTPFLARQTDVKVAYAPNSFERSKRAMAKLEEVGTEELVAHTNLGREDAARIIGETLRAETDTLRLADRRGRLRIDAIKSRFPLLHRIVRKAKALRNRAANVDPLAPDTRLPRTPSLSTVEREMALVRRACRPFEADDVRADL